MSRYKDYLIGLESSDMYRIGWQAYESGLAKDQNPYHTSYFRDAWDWGWESAKIHNQPDES